MSKLSDRHVDCAFLGFVCVFGLVLFMLPVAVLTGVPPHVWGSLSIGALPLGPLTGYIVSVLRGKP